MIKKFIAWGAKAVIAAIASLCILTGFCYFYYNLPIHHDSLSGSTDYYWDANALSIRATEGFAISKTDDNGFVNSYPAHGNTLDILIMGSSHTEGMNVNADENYPYVLNSMLDEQDADLYAYSIGMSGHAIVRCFRNLDDALNEYKPRKYVFIETSTIMPSLESLQQLEENTFDVLSSHDSGLLYHLQRNDYFRLLYMQLQNMIKDNDQAATSSSEAADDLVLYERYLELMLKKGSETAAANGCKLVIIYKPDLVLNRDGSIANQELNEKEKLFKDLCEAHGIGLIDMYEPFTEYYQATYCLPNGFSNTKVGTGHLNRHGHLVIAQELSEYITEDTLE